jgi:cytoskeletal protein CcmA (bactofilin family)
MFKKSTTGTNSSKEEKKMPLKKEDNTLKAYLGADAEFKGSLTFEGTVRIDGKFEGEVITEDTLVVGEGGQVLANITAGTVVCKGRIEGTVIASNRVEIHTNAQVVGTVRSPALSVELGAILDGNCDMESQGTNKIVKLVQSQNEDENDISASR